MVYIDLTDIEERRKAVASGLIWSAPDGAIEQALQDVAAGLIPPPGHVPSEWAARAEELGIPAPGGMMPGSGPA